MSIYETLSVETRGHVLLVGLNRPHKRNAVSDGTIDDVAALFGRLPAEVKVVVLFGHGEHFCAGVDLSEHCERDAFSVLQHSRMSHRAFDAIQFCGVPVVAALHGAVVGAGLEMASATHVRVAEPSTFYALPEGQRGIFVGAGGSVRVARIIGAGRMAEMMLTGRPYDADQGLALGLSHHLVGKGEALGKALELAERIATNAPLSNYAVVNALPRIADMSPAEGLFTESLMTAMTCTAPEAQERIRAFLDKRAAKAGQ